MQTAPIPQDFINTVEPIFTDKKEFFSFIESLKLTSKRATRYNPNKILPTLKNPVPWSLDAEYVLPEKTYKNDPLWHLGAVYSQEPSSMILGEILSQLQPKKVLDLCASPGGKSTLALARITPESLLIANEVVTKRVHKLIDNLEKWGNSNVVVTQNQGQDFSRLGEFFDCVLVDAPCSGEGLARKDAFLWNHWSLEMVKKDALRQKEILENILPAIEVGGYLVYSTCTFNKIENEDITTWLLEKYPELEAIDLEFNKEWNLFSLQKGCYKMLPHKLDGEGFSFAIFKKKARLEKVLTNEFKPKKSEFVFKELNKQDLEVVAKFIQNTNNFFLYKKDNQVLAINKMHHKDILKFLELDFRVHKYSFKVGTFGHKEFVPHHQTLLCCQQNKNIPTLEISEQKSLEVMQGKTLEIDDLMIQEVHTKSDWIILTYQNIPLSWAKVNEKRINTFYPKELRIAD